MKKIVNIIFAAGIIFGFITCKQADSIYEEYIVPNGLIYPGKALDVVTRSGLGKIEISWKNGNDPNVVKARISWNNDSQGLDIAVDTTMKVISKIIELEEDTYSFLIRTYDAQDNVSVAVEVMGTVLGKNYVRTLVNRMVKSAKFEADIFVIEWGDAAAAEVGIELTYTDVGGNPQTKTIDPSETITMIDDLKAGALVYYATMYKPDASALDTFRAQRARMGYSANITKYVFVGRTEIPFEKDGDEPVYAHVYKIKDWDVNPQMAVNGNMSIADGNVLAFWVCNASGFTTPSQLITNGKISQTVELEEGTYRFDVNLGLFWAFGNPWEVIQNQVVRIGAAVGKELPDADAPEAQNFPLLYVLNFSMSASYQFTLNEKSTVTLGVVATITPSLFVTFTKIELWML